MIRCPLQVVTARRKWCEKDLHCEAALEKWGCVQLHIEESMSDDSLSVVRSTKEAVQKGLVSRSSIQTLKRWCGVQFVLQV